MVSVLSPSHLSVHFPDPEQLYVESNEDSYQRTVTKAKTLFEGIQKNEYLQQTFADIGINLIGKEVSKLPDRYVIETYLALYDTILTMRWYFPTYDCSLLECDISILNGTSLLENPTLLTSWLKRLEAINILYILENGEMSGRRPVIPDIELLNRWKTKLLSGNEALRMNFSIANDDRDEVAVIESFQEYDEIYSSINKSINTWYTCPEPTKLMLPQESFKKPNTFPPHIIIEEPTLMPPLPGESDSSDFEECSSTLTLPQSPTNSDDSRKSDEMTGLTSEFKQLFLSKDNQEMFFLRDAQRCHNLLRSNKELRNCFLLLLDRCPSSECSEINALFEAFNALQALILLPKDSTPIFYTACSFIRNMARNPDLVIKLMSSTIDALIAQETLTLFRIFADLAIMTNKSLKELSSWKKHFEHLSNTALSPHEMEEPLRSFYQNKAVTDGLKEFSRLDLQKAPHTLAFNLLVGRLTQSLKQFLPPEGIKFLDPVHEMKYRRYVAGLMKSNPQAAYMWIILLTLPNMDKIPQKIVQEIVKKFLSF